MGLATEKGFAFTAAREACVLTAHRDTKNLAIGFGLNAPGLKEGDTCSLDEAIAAFVAYGTAICEHDVDRVFVGLKLLPHQYDALFSLAWNLGGTRLRAASALIYAISQFIETHEPAGSPAWRKLRDRAGLEIVLARYTDEDGPFNFSRRCREAVLFTTGDYGDLSRIPFWDRGKSPKHEPPDPGTWLPMPTFLKETNNGALPVR